MPECVLFEQRAFTADGRRDIDTVHKAIGANTSRRVDALTLVAKCSEHELENSAEITNTVWKLRFLRRR